MNIIHWNDDSIILWIVFWLENSLILWILQRSPGEPQQQFSNLLDCARFSLTVKNSQYMWMIHNILEFINNWNQEFIKYMNQEFINNMNQQFIVIMNSIILWIVFWLQNSLKWWIQ